MFSTRDRSSMHTPPGRHISRRLQLEQVTSNLRASLLVISIFLRTAAGMAVLPSVLRLAGTLGDELAHAVHIVGLVEEAARAERLGELTVRVGVEAGQHVDVDLR